MKKLHPAIPTIRGLTTSMEYQFRTLTRGKKHTVPQKERDVKLLTEKYVAAHLNKHVHGRNAATKDDLYKDFIDEGAQAIVTKNVLSKWHEGRCFVREIAEDWQTDNLN